MEVKSEDQKKGKPGGGVKESKVDEKFDDEYDSEIENLLVEFGNKEGNSSNKDIASSNISSNIFTGSDLSFDKKTSDESCVKNQPMEIVKNMDGSSNKHTKEKDQISSPSNKSLQAKDIGKDSKEKTNNLPNNEKSPNIEEPQKGVPPCKEEPENGVPPYKEKPGMGAPSYKEELGKGMPPYKEPPQRKIMLSYSTELLNMDTSFDSIDNNNGGNLLCDSMVQVFLGVPAVKAEKKKRLIAKQIAEDTQIAERIQETYVKSNTKESKENEKTKDSDCHSIYSVKSLDKQFSVEKIASLSERYIKAIDVISPTTSKDVKEGPSYLETNDINVKLKEISDNILGMGDDDLSSQGSPIPSKINEPYFPPKTVNVPVRAKSILSMGDDDLSSQGSPMPSKINEPYFPPKTIKVPVRTKSINKEVVLQQAVGCANQLINKFEITRKSNEENKRKMLDGNKKIFKLNADVKKLTEDLDTCNKDKDELQQNLQLKTEEIQKQTILQQTVESKYETLKAKIDANNEQYEAEHKEFKQKLKLKEEEIEKLRNQLNKLKETEPIVGEQKENQNETVMQLNKTIDALKKKIDAKSRSIAGLQKLVLQSKSNKSEIKMTPNTNGDVNDDKSKEFQKALNVKDKTIAELRQSLEDVRSLKNELHQKLSEVQRTLELEKARHENVIAQLKANSEKKSLPKDDTEINSLRKDLDDRDRKIEELRQSLVEVRSSKEEYVVKLAQVQNSFKQEKIHHEKVLSQLKSKLDNKGYSNDHSINIDALRKDLRHKEKTIEELRQSLIEVSSSKEEYVEKLTQIQQKFEQEKSVLQLKPQKVEKSSSDFNVENLQRELLMKEKTIKELRQSFKEVRSSKEEYAEKLTQIQQKFEQEKALLQLKPQMGEKLSRDFTVENFHRELLMKDKAIMEVNQSLLDARNSNDEYRTMLTKVRQAFKREKAEYEDVIIELKSKLNRKFGMLENDLKEKGEKVFELESKLSKVNKEKKEEFERLQKIIKYDHEILIDVKEQVKNDSKYLEKLQQQNTTACMESANGILNETILKNNEKIILSSRRLDEVVNKLNNVGNLPISQIKGKSEKMLELKFTEVRDANVELRKQLQFCKSDYNVCREENTKLQVDIKKLYEKVKDMGKLETKNSLMKEKLLKAILQNKSLKSTLCGKENLLKSLSSSIKEYRSALEKHENTNMHCCFQVKIRKENLEEQVQSLEEKLRKYITVEKDLNKSKDIIHNLKSVCKQLKTRLEEAKNASKVENIHKEKVKTDEASKGEVNKRTIESGPNVINFNLSLDTKSCQLKNSNDVEQDMSEKLVSLKQQNEKLLSLINDKGKEKKVSTDNVNTSFDVMKQKVEELLNENEKLKRLIQEKEKEKDNVNEVNKKSASTENDKQIKYLENEIDELKSINILLNKEIDELKDIDNRNKIDFNQMKVLESENKKLKSKIDELDNKIEELQESYDAFNEKVNILQNEKEKTMADYEERMQKINEEFKNEKLQNKKLDSINISLEEQIKQLKGETSESLKEEIQKLRSHMMEISTSKQNNEELIKILKEEKAHLLMDIDRLQHEICDLKQKQNFHTLNTQRRNAAIFAYDDQSERNSELTNEKITRETPLLDGNKLNASTKKIPAWLVPSTTENHHNQKNDNLNTQVRVGQHRDEDSIFDGNRARTAIPAGRNSRNENSYLENNMNPANNARAASTGYGSNNNNLTNVTPRNSIPTWLQSQPTINKQKEIDNDDLFLIEQTVGDRRRNNVPIRGNIQYQPSARPKTNDNSTNYNPMNTFENNDTKKAVTKRTRNESTWSDDEGDFIKRTLGRK